MTLRFSDGVEFDTSGLTPVPSERIRPARVAESPLSLECRLLRTVTIEGSPTTMVLGEVLLIHAADEVLTDGMPDPAKLRPLGRLGASLYARLGEIVEIPPP